MLTELHLTMMAILSLLILNSRRIYSSLAHCLPSLSITGWETWLVQDVQATAQPEASPEAEAAQASGQRAGSAAEQQAASSPGQLAAPEAEQQTAPAAELQAAPPAEEGTVPEPQGTPVAVEDAPKSLQPFAAPGPPLPEHEEMQAAVQCAVRAAAGAEAAGEAEEPQVMTPQQHTCVS